MPSTYRVLGQANPVAATLVEVYTVPAATQAVISTIAICNRAATATSFRVSVAVAGAADAPQQYIAYDLPIAANEVQPITIGVSLATGDVIRVSAAAATLSFSIFGVELT